MSKHTPASWWVTDFGVRDRGGYICHTNPAQRYEGQDERFKEESAERAANKFLIAAAPELLEALKYARRFLNQVDHDFAYVDAVIAKATGEQA